MAEYQLCRAKEKARLKSFQTVWFRSHHVLEKAKLLGQVTGQTLPGAKVGLLHGRGAESLVDGVGIPLS